MAKRCEIFLPEASTASRPAGTQLTAEDQCLASAVTLAEPSALPLLVGRRSADHDEPAESGPEGNVIFPARVGSHARDIARRPVPDNALSEVLDLGRRH